MDRDELLEQSVEYFRKTFSRNGKLKINNDIIRRIQYLQEAFEMEGGEIFQHLFDGYLSKRIYEKYQAEKALSTFIAYCVKYGLNDLCRKQENRQKNKKESYLEALCDDPLCSADSSSLNTLGKDGLASLIEFTTPEELVAGQELMDLIFAHFGATDALVVLGYQDRDTVAESLSLSYDAYRKRLLRKKLSFVQVLEEAGYQIH